MKLNEVLLVVFGFELCALFIHIVLQNVLWVAIMLGICLIHFFYVGEF